MSIEDDDWAEGLKTAEIRQPYAWRMKVSDGKVVEVHEHHTKEEALEAAGLRE